MLLKAPANATECAHALICIRTIHCLFIISSPLPVVCRENRAFCPLKQFSKWNTFPDTLKWTRKRDVNCRKSLVNDQQVRFAVMCIFNECVLYKRSFYNIGLRKVDIFKHLCIFSVISCIRHPIYFLPSIYRNYIRYLFCYTENINRVWEHDQSYWRMFKRVLYLNISHKSLLIAAVSLQSLQLSLRSYSLKASTSNVCCLI